MGWKWFLLAIAACSGIPVNAVAKRDVPALEEDEQTLKAADINTSDQALLEFFRKRTLGDIDRARMNHFVNQLGDDSFDAREKASAALVAIGNPAESLLRQALRSPDIEVVRRAEECLRLIKNGVSTSVPLSATRILAQRKPAGASAALLGYLPFADSEAVTHEIREALVAMALQGGHADPVLVKALADKDPARRASAAEALWRAKDKEHRGEVIGLLKDPDLTVRLRVSVVLALSREKDAIPVLIDLLGSLPPQQAWQAVDLLARLAGEKAPQVPLGSDDAGRRQCRQAWLDWWQANAATVDFAKIDKPTQLGYTLVLLLDAGEAIEVDRQGKERWHLRGLQFPLDVQYLPGDHVLTAEHHGNRVTERDLKGNIVWEKLVVEPLMAQRLPNGNTFIATSTQLMEVDNAGKDVFNFQPGQGELVMKAVKLPNGEIVCVMFGNKLARLDSTGKELSSFAVNVQTSGGRLDVSPNGHVLIPEMTANRVVEYDANGKVARELEVEQPIAAARLPTGNILVTSMTLKRALELDPQGKIVWEYKSPSRVNRAYRR